MSEQNQIPRRDFIKNTALIIVMLFINSIAFAHPTGNMITVGENVLPHHYRSLQLLTAIQQEHASHLHLVVV